MSTPAQRLESDRNRFPGLLPREVLVLRNWLKLHEQEYERFDYNLRLGDGVDPGPQFPEDVRRMAILNTQKRVDAVGWISNQATLIEVKDRAGFSSIGQLVGYDALFRKQFPAFPEPKLRLVCNRFAGDILTVIERQGIAFDVVEVDFGILRQTKR